MGRRPGSDRRHRHRRRPCRRPWTCARATTAGTFTVVFFTDGQPTIGETNPDEDPARTSLANNTANTRIFTFGVGDDVNASLARPAGRADPGRQHLRPPAEDIEAKVSGLYAKISHPVLTEPEADGRQGRHAFGGLSAAAARPVPRQPAGGAGPLPRPGPRGHQADRQASARKRRSSSTRCNFPEKTDDDKDVRRGPVGAAQGRLHARPDPQSTARRRNWSTRWWRWRRSTASPRRTPATWSCRTACRDRGPLGDRASAAGRTSASI